MDDKRSEKTPQQLAQQLAVATKTTADREILTGLLSLPSYPNQPSLKEVTARALDGEIIIASDCPISCNEFTIASKVYRAGIGNLQHPSRPGGYAIIPELFNTPTMKQQRSHNILKKIEQIQRDENTRISIFSPQEMWLHEVTETGDPEFLGKFLAALGKDWSVIWGDDKSLPIFYDTTVYKPVQRYSAPADQSGERRLRVTFELIGITKPV